ncbi:MAG: AMP-binding protein [Clostridiales bacterium]|nr:AMP-binding protein [Clostridiales bacterium]
MENQSYLAGFTPYPREIVEKYTAEGWWGTQTIGDSFDELVGRHPDKTAIIDEGKRLTYAQFQRMINAFAAALLDIGIKKHDRVLIQIPNKHEFIVSYIACQKIGAIPVLAVSSMGRVEISYIIELTEPSAWIVAERDGSKEFPHMVRPLVESAKKPIKVVYLMESGDPVANYGSPDDTFSYDEIIRKAEAAGHPADYLDRFRPDPNDVAHLLITGGTTGLSKAVPRTHNSYLANVRATNARFGADSIFYLCTPIGHSMALDGAIGGNIWQGNTLVITRKYKTADILAAVSQQKVSVLRVVPTQFIGMLDFPDLYSYDLSSLKSFMTSGAALGPDVAAKAYEFCQKIGCTFYWSGYGSSEGPSTKHIIGESMEKSLTSVGVSMVPGNRWTVVDENEEELPSGSTGELVVKGPSVFTGYFKSPNNREIFTRDGYYKTGDLGKIDEEGYIYITGRRKDIIQRGGETLAPQEIEHVLVNHPAIAQIAVIGMPDPYMGERACAYVIPKPGTSLTFDEMIDYLKGLEVGKLMWPERLEIIDAMPLTDIGKIDKKALRKDISDKLEKEGKLAAT